MTDPSVPPLVALPPLVAVTGQVSPEARQLYMATDNPKTLSRTSHSLFYAADGALVFK